MLVALIIGSLTPVVALPIAVLFMGERLTAVEGACARLWPPAGVVAAVLAAPPTRRRQQLAGGLPVGRRQPAHLGGLPAGQQAGPAQVETVRLMWVLSFVGALTVSVIALVVQPDLGEMQGKDWLWVVLLSSGPGILGHGLFAWARPRVDSSVSSVLIQAEPVGATFGPGCSSARRCRCPQVVCDGRRAGGAGGARLPRGARDRVIVVDEALDLSGPSLLVDGDDLSMSMGCSGGPSPRVAPAPSSAATTPRSSAMT